MRPAALLVALSFAVAACATPVQQASVPVLLRFKSPEQGGPRALPEASPSGRLDLSGPCVQLETHPGATVVIVSTAEARVGHDSRGPYLQYRNHRLRHGQWVKGGGGYFDALPTRFGPLDGPVPEACRAESFLIFSGIEPAVRSSSPPKSPPPPPIG